MKIIKIKYVNKINNFMTCENIINIIGLTISFVGTLFILSATSKDINEYIKGERGQKNGERWYSVVTKHPCRLRTGAVLIAIGFFLSLLGGLLKF